VEYKLDVKPTSMNDEAYNNVSATNSYVPSWH
jgi:hypothetical protein